MATKTILIVCAHEPQTPAHYTSGRLAASLRRHGDLWAGTSLDGINISEEPPSPRAHRAYPWTIAKVIRMVGPANPASIWWTAREIYDAVLSGVGGVVLNGAYKRLAVRLPAEARDALWGAIEAAIERDEATFLAALGAALAWGDEPFTQQIAARLSPWQAPEPYEVLVKTLDGRTPEPIVARWLKTPVGTGTLLTEMLAAADARGLTLLPRARAQLDRQRTHERRFWAQRNPPASADVGAVLSRAAAGDRDEAEVLSVWCEYRALDDAQAAALGAALATYSATLGPWPEPLRKPVGALARKQGAGAFAGHTLHPDDARWVAEQAAQGAAEAQRYEDLVAGINTRNAERVRKI
jgi:hypothetical protein